MPKRVLDGEGLWRSDKLAQVKPPSRRAEYANLVPLALANGTFEAGSRRIWSTVYSCNRPDVSAKDVEEILAEFERVKLLFRWTDAATGKMWGYWIGIDKPGRLVDQFFPWLAVSTTGNERAAHGADTCSTDCQREKRKASRRFQKLFNVERLLASPAIRRRLQERERTAPVHAMGATQ